jgi:hypothetical protein
VVGQRLEQIVAQVPPHREAIRDRPHELAFGAQILEEHHQLQLEEDDRVNRRPAALSVERLYQLPHKREVEPSLKAPVEVLFGD